jgi:hypothetical protein
MIPADMQFVDELIQAANRMRFITLDERAQLAQRAANRIRGLQNLTGTADDAAIFAISRLASIGSMPGSHSSGEASAKLLEAVQVIRGLEKMVETRRQSGAE